MSWQAHEAVDRHSKHTKIHLFKLLHRLAGLADAAGVIDMAPAQSTMAEWFGVSERTIRNWLNELIASGELAQTRVGSGPGNPSAYQISLPMPTGKAEKAEENPAKMETKVEKVEEIAAILSAFAAAIDELKAEIKSLKSSTFPAKGGKGGSQRWKRWKPKVETGSRGGPQTIRDQSVIQSDLGKNTPQTPLAPTSNPFPFKPSRKNPEPTPADGRVAAIVRVCGLDLTVPAHVTQAQNAAAQLSSYSSEVILARYLPGGARGEGWNWYGDDWRGQRGDMPRPAQVVETISLERQAATPKANGQHPVGDLPNAVKAAVSYAEKRKRFLGGEQ